MARKIEVQLIGDSRSLERAFSRAQSSGSKLSRTIGTGLKVAAGAGIAALGGLAVVAKVGFDEFNQAQKVTAQTNAVLKSTGRIANVTAEQVDDLAQSLMRKSGVDDEAIKSGENMLLTFTKIRNEAGKGNDIFNQATQATLDLSVAMGKDLQSSAILVGKALNDPIKGSTALTRAGIQLTDQQKEQIKTLVENGETMKAQKIILEELTTQFGGSALAASKTFSGQINILRERFNNWAGDLVARFMPAIEDTLDTFNKFIDRFSRAQGFKARLNIVWLGVSGAVSDLFAKLRKEMLGGRELLKLPGGKVLEWSDTQGVIDKLRDAIEGADWAEIGATIGENISSRVKITAEFITNVLETANRVIDQNIDKFAALGAKMLLSIISKLMDPAFWKDNWKLILGIAISVFPLGRVGGLGAKVGRVFAAPLVRVFERIVNRLPTVLGLAALEMIRVLGKFAGFIGGRLKTMLLSIPGWIRVAFRLSFVLAFVAGVKSAFNQIRGAVERVVEFIRKQFARVPGFLQPVRVAFFGILGPIQLAIAAVQRLIDWIGRIPSPGDIVGGISGAIGKLPGLASGGDIARSGVAVVHRGERVLPARVVNRGGAAAAGGPGQFALIWAGPDFFRWMDEQQARRRRKGYLA